MGNRIQQNMPSCNLGGCMVKHPVSSGTITRSCRRVTNLCSFVDGEFPDIYERVSIVFFTYSTIDRNRIRIRDAEAPNSAAKTIHISRMRTDVGRESGSVKCTWLREFLCLCLYLTLTCAYASSASIWDSAFGNLAYDDGSTAARLVLPIAFFFSWFPLLVLGLGTWFRHRVRGKVTTCSTLK